VATSGVMARIRRDTQSFSPLTFFGTSARRPWFRWVNRRVLEPAAQAIQAAGASLPFCCSRSFSPGQSKPAQGPVKADIARIGHPPRG
jgi:hypothetical protein